MRNLRKHLKKGEIKRSATILGLGLAFICLGVATLFYASQASQYARDFHSVRAEVKDIETKLNVIEAAMTKVDTYSDAIDDLTMATVSVEKDQKEFVAHKLEEVDNVLDKLKNSGSSDAQESLSNRVEDMVVASERAEKTMHGLVGLLRSQQHVLQATPTITPAEGWVSSSYGLRVSPFLGTEVVHQGMDIGAEPGTPVYAAADGIVEYTGFSPSLGKLVVLNHSFEMLTKYGHNSAILVHKGQVVKRGQKIALVGSTGRSTGPHLHYEVWVNRKPVDPRTFLLDKQLDEIDIQPVAMLAQQIGGEEFDFLSAAAHVIVPKKVVANKVTAPIVPVVSQPQIAAAAPIAWRKIVGAGLMSVALLLGLGLVIISSQGRRQISF